MEDSFRFKLVYSLYFVIRARRRLSLVGWLYLGIYVALSVFQSYRDLEAGDNQSLKFEWRDRESNPGPLAPQAKRLTSRPPPLPDEDVGSRLLIHDCVILRLESSPREAVVCSLYQLAAF